jgi:N12 class adenine-specific DNA methylase
MNVIPTARMIKLRGVDLVAVPDKLDEVKVLNNIGFQVDSPMLRYYPWPGQYTPFETQRKTAAFMAMHKRAFCLNDMGVGKTLSILWAYDYLRSLGIVDKMLVTTPLSTLERVWGDEIFNNFPKLKFSVVHGTREKRWKALDRDVNIYLINHDGIKTDGIEERLKQRSDISIITIDEISESFRNSGTDNFRTMKRIIEANKWRRVWGYDRHTHAQCANGCMGTV